MGQYKMSTQEIKDLLVNKNANEKHQIKSSEIVDECATGDIDFEDNNNKLKIKFLTRPEIDIETGLLKFNLEVKDKDNKKLPISNPFLIKNPPILIQDGTTNEVTENVMGHNITSSIPNYIYDPIRALQASILHTLHVLNL
jgi:hypothetical protein